MAKRTNKSPRSDVRQRFPADTVQRFAQAMVDQGGLNEAIKFLWNEDGQDRSEQSWRNYHTRRVDEIDAKVKQINGRRPVYQRRDNKRKDGKNHIVKKKARKSDERTESQRAFDDESSESSQDDRPKLASASKPKKKSPVKPRASEPVRKPSRLAEDARRSLPTRPTTISESDEDPIQPTSDEEVEQELNKPNKGKGKMISSRTAPAPRIKITENHRLQRVAQSADALAKDLQALEPEPELEEPPSSPPRVRSSSGHDQDITMVEPRQSTIPPQDMVETQTGETQHWFQNMSKTLGKPIPKNNDDDIADLLDGTEVETQTQVPVASTARLPLEEEEAFEPESPPQPSKKRSAEGMRNTTYKKARLEQEQARSRRRNDADPDDQMPLDEYPSRGKETSKRKIWAIPSSAKHKVVAATPSEEEPEKGQDDSQVDQLEDSRVDQLEDSQLDQLASDSDTGIITKKRTKPTASPETSRSRSKSHRSSAAPSRKSKSYSHSASPRKASPLPEEEDVDADDQVSQSDAEIDELDNRDARLHFQTTCNAVQFHAQQNLDALYQLPRQIANLYHACGGVKMVMEARNKPRDKRNAQEKRLVRNGCFTKAQDRIIIRRFENKEGEKWEQLVEERGGDNGLKRRWKYLKNEGRMFR